MTQLVLLVFFLPPTLSVAETVLKIRTATLLNSEEVVGLNSFFNDIENLTNGELKFKLVPYGEGSPEGDLLSAVDLGLIDGVFGRADYWSDKHPATILFGSPIAGAGVGLDNLTFLSWIYYGGGDQLYDQLWEEMNLNVKSFVVQSAGPQSLGWFKEPIKSVGDLRKRKFKTPSGIVGQTYKDIGISPIYMRLGDILPEFEKGRIDAVSLCCPKSDLEFGLHELMKNYYLQGSHNYILNSDLFINGDVYRSLTSQQKKAIEVSSHASILKHMSLLIFENGKALEELTENYGVITHDTPIDYFALYMLGARVALEKLAAENAFFAEVWQSQKDFAEITIPFSSEKQATKALMGRLFLKNKIIEK